MKRNAHGTRMFAVSTTAVSNTNERSRLRSWQVVVFVALFFGYFMYTAARRGIAVVQEPMMSELDLTMADIGMLNSAFTVMYGGSKFLGSLLADIFSASTLFAVGLAAAGFANVVVGGSSSRAVALGAWSFNGALQGLGWPALSAMVMSWFEPAQRGSVWSTCTVASNLAKSVAPMAMAAVAERFSWRAALTGPGYMALLVALLIMVMLKDNPQAAGLPSISTLKDEKSATRNRLKHKSAHASWVRVLRNPDFWLISLANAFVYFILQGLSDWTPQILSQYHGMKSEAAAAGLFWYEAGGIVSTFTSGFVSDRLHGNRGLTALLFSALCAPGILVIMMTPVIVGGDGGVTRPALLSVGLFIVGAGANGPKTMCGLEVRERFPEAAGAAGALLGLMGQIGATSAGWPLTQAYQRYGGWGAVLQLLLSAAVCASAMFGGLIILRTRAWPLLSQSQSQLTKLKSN